MRKLLIFLSVFSLLLLGVFSQRGAGAAEPGYAGADTCKVCHEERYDGYFKSSHGIKADPRTPAAKQECETCHGPGLSHAEKGGGKGVGDVVPLSVASRTVAEKINATCLRCHSKDRNLMFWKGSSHNMRDLACSSCHQIHPSDGRVKNLLKAQDQKEVCFDCHYNIRSAMFKRSKHPMRDSSSSFADGKMNCSSCHNPHGARSDKMVDARSVNDKCYECHEEKKAPVLWEHAPVKENCLVCHDAHGSSNDKMLVTMVPRLCQQCHMQGRHQTGTLATNSAFLFNRACLNCHSMVHGSNAPSGPVLQR